MSHHHHHPRHHHPHHHGPRHHGPRHPPPHHQGVAVIRNPKSGLVLDASEYEVKLQNFTGFPAQLWTIEPTPNGSHIIINQRTGHALDIQGGVKEGANLITYQKHGLQNQQWVLNPDGTITNGHLAVDIYGGFYTPGNRVIAYTRKTHAFENQIFQLQYQ